MASNSEANLSSDFDIDEVINWGEQNYSSKGIEFQLPQLGLPSDAKVSQNTAVTLPNLGSAVATSQQTSLQGAQNTGSFYSSFFGTTNNPSVVGNSKSHGFPPRQTLVSPNTLSFPTENLNIPSIATPSSNSSLLQFGPNLVGQNTSLASQLCMPPLQNVQNSSNLINDDVSPFTDGIDDDTDLFEGPLDKIVDQIMDRQISITESPSLSSSYDDDTPVITFSNQQASAPNVQLSSSISPPSRSILSPNMPSRNVTSPNIASQSVPSPNAPTRTVPSPVNPSQNLLSSNTSSRNVPMQSIPSTKIILPNIPQSNVSSQNAPSSGLAPSGTHTYSTIQGLGTPPSEQGIPTQTHSKFRLQTPASVASSMVNTLGQSTMKPLSKSSGKPSVTNLPISNGQTELSANTLFQPITSQVSQRGNQSYPSFMLQNPNQTLIRQPASTNFTPSTNKQSNASWFQSSNSLEDLLRMQTSIRNTSPNLTQTQFTNQLARSTSVNKIGAEQSQSNAPLFVTTSNGTERSVSYVSPFFTHVGDTLTNDSHLKISSASLSTPSESNATSMKPNINISQYNATSDSNSKIVASQLQTSASRSVSYPGQIVSDLSSDRVSPRGQTNEIQDTSITEDIPNLHEALEPTRPLSPRSNQETVTSSNQFFLQNFSDVNESTAEMSRQEKMFSNNVSLSQNAVSNNLISGKLLVTTETPSKPQQSNKSVFTLISPAVTTLPQTNSQSQKLVNPPVLLSVKNPVNSSQPTGITTIKITSPSVNSSGFKYPTVGLSPRPAPKAVSIQTPRTTTIRLKSPTNVTTSSFPTFRLTNPNVGTTIRSTNTRPMVFTLAPGSQAAATLKNLPVNIKDKLAGRQVIFLQQPSGQPINTPKQQPMKIIFVNDGSIAQVVSGPVKTKVTQPSTQPVVSVSPAQKVFSKDLLPSSTESKSAPPAVTESLIFQDSEADSPSSVNSTDSDSVSIAALKQIEALKKQENESKDATEQKTRGRKRRKDPNRPVKPLSSFQRFFQATQHTVRQQSPQATFAEVSKTIKEMWENLHSKEKKVYQDAWRMERVQYKKAMNDYNASLGEVEADEPSPKQAKNIVIEVKDETDYAVPVSPVDIPVKTEISSPVVRTPFSPTVSSPSTVSSSFPAPRSTGKPLAMMAEIANKTKLASAQAAAAKATGMTKSLHVSKSKATNGIEEGVNIVKKKPKINPLPKKSCIRAYCNKPAKTTKERGTMFCSDDCVMRHCSGLHVGETMYRIDNGHVESVGLDDLEDHVTV